MVALRGGDVFSGLTDVVLVDSWFTSARIAGRAEDVIWTPVAAYFDDQHGVFDFI